MLNLYGIANCDTMKKARKWLTDHELDHAFHDYKKEAIEREKLEHWINLVGWEILLNRRGMMWRKLDDATKAKMDEALAIETMLQTPSIIKRPVLEISSTQIWVGFKETDYQTLLDE